MQKDYLIFTDFNNLRKFKAFFKETKLDKRRFYNFSSKFKLKEEIQSNYFLFTINKNQKIDKLFIPSSFYPELIDDFLKSIKKL